MPYAKDHAEQTRARILDSAGKLFTRCGYEAVSIDDLMRDAGLTRGAFYHHFANKAEVYAESILHNALRSPWATSSECAEPGAWFAHTVGAYLSHVHIDETPSPCPLAFLATDVVQRDGPVRGAYTRVYKNLVHQLSRRLSEVGTTSPQDAAHSLAAMLIGAVAVARALDDRNTIDRLLAGALATAEAALNPAQGGNSGRRTVEPKP